MRAVAAVAGRSLGCGGGCAADAQVQDGAVDADGLSEAGQGARNARQNTLASFPALGPPDLVYTVKRYRGLVGAPTYAVRTSGGAVAGRVGAGARVFFFLFFCACEAGIVACGVVLTESV